MAAMLLIYVQKRFSLHEKYTTFEVLTAASVKMAVFWVVAPCSLVEVYRRFRGACCLHYQGDVTSLTALMVEAAGTSEMPVKFYQTTRRNDPEDSHLNICYCFGIFDKNDRGQNRTRSPSNRPAYLIW
jgi:hypothetical protein